MSTFKGIVSEFPRIRVDFFRPQPGHPPPLACFLSHVHSDHLAGLETFNGCFIYCSAATKAILLRLEKSSVRLNTARGILEDPRLQTYRRLEKMLKPLPLDTPITIDLLHGSTIRVTLLDANHCVGAVMFLFEGPGTAVLYTGDIRCRKVLDRIYLDTSVLDNYSLQTKADALRELLEKVQKYPSDTIFHFRAWTYGYEEVWIALSKALNSKIHVDEYKMRVFQSLVIKPKNDRWATQTHLAKEAPALVGFTCGNNVHEGCLTSDENVRIHSCEKGMGCSVIENRPIVWIRPVVTHLNDEEDVMEVGIGGGGEDLADTTNLSPEDILDYMKLISASEKLTGHVHRTIQNALLTGRDISLPADTEDQMGDAAQRLIESLFRKFEDMCFPIKHKDEAATAATLPNVIRFPYARHSSLPELRDFVSAFNVRDITPCTFDTDLWLRNGWSIRGLFGDCCIGDLFQSDAELDYRVQERGLRNNKAEEQHQYSDQTTDSALGEKSPVVSPTLISNEITSTSNTPTRSRKELQLETTSASISWETVELSKNNYNLFQDSIDLYDGPDLQGDSPGPAISDQTYVTRRNAFQIATANIGGESWECIGLISTTDNHTSLNQELGEPWTHSSSKETL
ncbi:artemis protein [Xylaria palmicola]|nr:artemis protein [Xylaria palmicola]